MGNRMARPAAKLPMQHRPRRLWPQHPLQRPPAKHLSQRQLQPKHRPLRLRLRHRLRPRHRLLLLHRSRHRHQRRVSRPWVRRTNRVRTRRASEFTRPRRTKQRRLHLRHRPRPRRSQRSAGRTGLPRLLNVRLSHSRHCSCATQLDGETSPWTSMQRYIVRLLYSHLRLATIPTSPCSATGVWHLGTGLCASRACPCIASCRRYAGLGHCRCIPRATCIYLQQNRPVRAFFLRRRL